MLDLSRKAPAYAQAFRDDKWWSLATPSERELFSTHNKIEKTLRELGRSIDRQTAARQLRFRESPLVQPGSPDFKSAPFKTAEVAEW
ncbi:MAG: hypothetical protein M2R45_03130 [Verrucomicrobia subdivision 3 bacterium]|nr:hypothetical protein [Limisphaerales bacterium]MCS1413198.1 hypothetical protein [Limisphaerales bacterium]